MKKEQKYGYSYQVNEEKRVVTCIYTSNDGKWVGISKCDPEDNWDEEFGKELARKRAALKAIKTRVKRIDHYYPDYVMKDIANNYFTMIGDFERLESYEETAKDIEREIEKMIN